MKFEIKGDSLPVVIFDLDIGDSLVSQAGGMSWHTEDIMLSTEGRGGIGGMLGRALVGESIFQNVYTAKSNKQEIAFASSFPGAIIPVQLTGQNSLIVQKEAFLVSEIGVNTSIFIQKRVGAGFFGGEGFIMLSLTGEGMAFLEADGGVHEYTLEAGEKMTLSTGYLIAMDATCTMSIKAAGNVKSILFGGEGLVNSTVVGPGRIFIQSMPLKKLRESLKIGVSQNRNNQKRK